MVLILANRDSKDCGLFYSFNDSMYAISSNIVVELPKKPFYWQKMIWIQSFVYDDLFHKF